MSITQSAGMMFALARNNSHAKKQEGIPFLPIDMKLPPSP
jgi:hypothetical protein